MSIAVHVAVFFSMLALVFPFGRADREPDLPMVRVELVGPVEALPLAADPSPNRTEQSRPSDLPRPLPSDDIKIPPREFVPLSELRNPKMPELEIVGIGSSLAGPSATFSAFGLGGDLGPGPEFFGLGSSAPGARKVVFVVDRSGSMLDTFIFVQQELKRSVSQLRRSQKFHVIFFDGGPLLENPPQRLVSAIDAHKEQFFEFLDSVVVGGRTRPASAMRRALAMEPDLIYLLSDGLDFLEFQPSLLERLDEWNKDRRVRICTIAYLNQSASKVLEQIAYEHNGEFRFVSEDELE